MRAERELARAKLEARAARAEAKRAGSGEPGDVPKTGSTGMLFDGYA